MRLTDRVVIQDKCKMRFQSKRERTACPSSVAVHGRTVKATKTECNRASMQHTSSTRLLSKVLIVWKHQGSLQSAWLTFIWCREYQWIRAWRTHRPSVCTMDSWVRFSSQSQAKERVFRYTNTHCMHAYSCTTTCSACFLDCVNFAACLDTWRCCIGSWSYTFPPIYLTISKINNKAQWYSHVFGYGNVDFCCLVEKC